LEVTLEPAALSAAGSSSSSLASAGGSSGGGSMLSRAMGSLRRRNGSIRRRFSFTSRDSREGDDAVSVQGGDDTMSIQGGDEAAAAAASGGGGGAVQVVVRNADPAFVMSRGGSFRLGGHGSSSSDRSITVTLPSRADGERLVAVAAQAALDRRATLLVRTPADANLANLTMSFV
jgi:hypothetical protein